MRGRQVSARCEDANLRAPGIVTPGIKIAVRSATDESPSDPHSES